jgi:hypothetical protein
MVCFSGMIDSSFPPPLQNVAAQTEAVQSAFLPVEKTSHEGHE